MKISNIKTNISKLSFIFIAVFLFSLSLANSAKAASYWQCNSPRNNDLYDYFLSWSPQNRAEIIRFRYPKLGASVDGWGDNCAVGCDNLAGCGACECRCQGGDLYCADIWADNSSGKTVAQTCTWNLVSSYDSRCVPVSNLSSPANNSDFAKGQNILFSGDGSYDGNTKYPETLSYHWVIRTVDNHNAGNYSQDIEINTNSKSFYRNNLSVGSYYAFLTVRNTQGSYPMPNKWRFVRFDVTASCLGEIPGGATACPQDGTGLSDNLGWVNAGSLQTDCTSRKCEYYSCSPSFSCGEVRAEDICNENNCGQEVNYSGSCYDTAGCSESCSSPSDKDCSGSLQCPACSEKTNISNWIEVPAN